MKQLADIPPFSLLSKESLKGVFSCIRYEDHPKGSILLVQEISRVDKLYILSKGAAQYYFQQDDTRILKKKLGNGDTFGGISILMNDGISIRTLEVLEDSSFMTIDESVFINLCKQSEPFRDYFTSAFGKYMLNKSYAGIIFRHARDKELNLPFFNQPISAMFRPNIIICMDDTSIKDVSKKMVTAKSSAILVKAENKQISGLVTDADLKTRVLAKGLSPDTPVREIMSHPLVTIPADSQVFEVFLKMTAKDKRHLAVTSKTRDIIGILTQKNLISAQADATYLLIKTIHSAQNIEQLEGIHSRLSSLLLDPIKNGTNPEYITRLITAFSEAILDKVIQFTINEIGPAPCRFVFMIMGSEGRDEQTLISDQDNALIFDDIDDVAEARKIMDYFRKFANLTCDQLNTAGYAYCTGNNMAKNPKWCQPISVWKSYFTDWIKSIDPEKILYSSIFFDFRGAWGDFSLTEELTVFLRDSIQKWPVILRCLTENALLFKPPLTFFGKFIVEEKGGHQGSFDIKKALMPIIDFARIYSLKEGIDSTNTLSRLFRLYTKSKIDNKQYLNLIRAYTYLMRLRFLRQITTIMDENQEPDNYINPANLSALDQVMLKEIFKIIERLQQKIKIEFSGIAG